MEKSNHYPMGRWVHVVIDRPMGTSHPVYPDLIYPINYGYIPHVMGGDGEEQDAYVMGVTEPAECFDGVVIAVIQRLEDREEKWVVAPEGTDFCDKEILNAVAFQEQYFTVTLLR